MMDKIEYGDLYKFLASLGLALIVLAFVAPWLFLREPFDLQIEATKLAGLTQEARSLIIYRQQAAVVLIKSTPWISGIFLIVGIFSLGAGLLGWKRRQGVLDRKHNLEVDKLQKEIDKMSGEDLEAKLESESLEGQLPKKDKEEVVPPLPGGLTPKPHSRTRNRYGKVEAFLIERLTTCMAEQYVLLPHQQLGKAQIDVLLQAREKDKSDLVAEIKFSEYSLDWRYVRANLLKAVYLAELYGKTLGRDCIPVLYFVAPQSALSESDTEDLERRARNEARRLGVEVGLKFLAEENLENLSCRELTTAIYVGAKHGKASV